ncbi:MAG TPA: SHOCT domain-containing protein [Candidatus Limnocylindria bacterium]
MMGSEWGDIGWWGMGIGMVLWVLVLAVIIGFVVWLMNRTQGRSEGRRDESAEEILRRRYAGGDIDGEEYERRLAQLRR